jgi:hypothetical protein
MRFLSFLFATMALYGLFTATFGAAFISAFMAAFVKYAERKFDEQDRAYAADPRNAKAAEPPIRDALADHDCECS